MCEPTDATRFLSSIAMAPFAAALLVAASPFVRHVQEGAAPLAPIAAPTTGVLRKLPGAQAGYTLFAPFDVGDTYLIDLDGAIVHQWKSAFPPGQTVELLRNGHLLRAARDPGASSLHGGGEGGRIEEFDWEGNLVWSYVCCDDQRRQHHDFEPLPNGNVVLIAWEAKTLAEAVEMGRDADAARNGLWPDCLLEVKPRGVDGGDIVWEWHVWDHLIQDRDPGLPNFGVVADHPERLDLNANRRRTDAPTGGMTPEEAEALRKLGYLGPQGEGDAASPPAPAPPAGGDRPRRGGRGAGPGMDADWNHVNSVAYHAGLDQLVLSSHNQHEVWIVDHGTTTAEAASHSGGKRGHGGDFLFRWGNPQTWGMGGAEQQQLFGQHDARWIEPGLRGEGHLLVFNNNVKGGFGGPGMGGPGMGRPGMRGPGFGRGRVGGESAPAVASYVVELELPLLPDGTYARVENSVFGPAQPLWRFGGGAGEPTFFSPIVSGSERLRNGNTLISCGAEGYCVEVDAQGQVVWEFRNPFGRNAAPGGDPTARPRGPGGMGGMFAGAFYRATRIAPDHPALKGRKLSARPRDA